MDQLTAVYTNTKSDFDYLSNRVESIERNVSFLFSESERSSMLLTGLSIYFSTSIQDPRRISQINSAPDQSPQPSDAGVNSELDNIYRTLDDRQRRDYFDRLRSRLPQTPIPYLVYT